MSLPSSYPGASAVDSGSSPQSTSPVVAPNTLAAKSPYLDVPKLVFDGDILILALFAVFFVLSLPRILGRFSRGIEWSRGHFLRSVRLSTRGTRRPTRSSPSDGPTQKGADLNTDDSHTLYSHTHILSGNDEKSTTFPPHVPTISSYLHFIATPLRYRLSPGYSLGQAFIVGIYGAILLYETFDKSDPFTDPVRAGYVAMGQIPFVFAFTAKNNILGSLVGLGYEKVRPIDFFQW